jgi:predicted metal-dependent phosphoesterase TrpH
MLIDLQLHSNYSDGYLSPIELAKFVKKNNIKIASLTDHNTLGGLKSFSLECKKYGIKFIPGIELYVKLGNTKFNMLWFNFKDRDDKLHVFLRDTHLRRRTNVRRALEILIGKGLKIEVEKALDRFSRYIPINRLVDILKENKQNLRNFKKDLGSDNPREEEIIRFYFKNKNNAFLRESYVSVERIFKLRKQIGGQLILNHPAKFGNVKKGLIEKLKKMGIDGIEVFSPHHSLGATMYLQQLAKEFDFISTGGSDFHRHEDKKFKVQNSWEYYKIDTKFLRKIDKIIG